MPPPPRVNRKTSDAWAWVSKSRASEVAGYSVRNFSERIQPRLPTTATRGENAAKRFDVREVAKVAVAYAIEQNQPKPECVDPLLGDVDGETTDALEAYRREATVKLKLQNAETRKELIGREAIELALAAGFAAAAECGSALVKRFGNEAGELWNEGIETMQETARKALPHNNDAPPVDA